MTEPSHGRVHVRGALQSDWPTIRALPIVVPDLPVGDPDARADTPYGQRYVATEPDGTVVGTVVATHPGGASTGRLGPGEGGLEQLALTDGDDADAIGAALVRRCLADAAANRLDRVVLYTPSEAAVLDFEDLGFHPMPWRDCLTADGQALRALVLDLARVVVRPAEPAEYERAGAVTLAGYVADGVVDPSHSYARRLADAGARAAAATLLVAVDPAGTVVGTVTFCRPGGAYAEVSRPGEAEFRMLAVDPAARGSGVGSALVHACLDRAGAAGDHAVVLSTLAQMRAAARLYGRLGFVADPDRDWSPEPGIDLLAYSRRVRPDGVDPAAPKLTPSAGQVTR